jgi:hypothetical protein
MSTMFQCVVGNCKKIKNKAKGFTSAFVADSGGVLQDDGIAVQQRSFGVRRQQRQRVAGPQTKFANVQLERHRLDQLADGAFARRRNLSNNKVTRVSRVLKAGEYETSHEQTKAFNRETCQND